MSKSWDEIYQKEGRKYVSRLTYLEKLSKFWKENKVKRVLDVGCGAGEHLRKMNDYGFEVAGMDISEKAVDIARDKFKNSKARSDIKVASMHNEWPFVDESFGGVMALRSFNHGFLREIRFAIEEVRRMLKPGGWFFMTTLMIPGRKVVQGITTLNTMKAVMIRPRTYVPLEGKEVGVVHYIFNKKIIRQELSGFVIEDLWVDYGEKEWERYYCVLAKKLA